MIELLGMTIEELENLAVDLGEKSFRGKQIYTWLNRGVESIDEMTNLPGAFRKKLETAACISGCRLLKIQEDSGDGTRKFLFEIGTGGKSVCSIESVFMKYRYGNTICVSSQAGCRMGCRFCASTLGGLVRNLTPGEMLAQIISAEKYTGEAINHVVVMGMGEPFDNYENLSRYLLLLHDPAGRNMSYRNITVSTCGVVPYIRRFADDFPQVNLAVSLHRLNDRGRSEIMPINRRYGLNELLTEVSRYTDRTGRRVTFEYALIKGENDGDDDVALMIEKLGKILCHVNLIPLNEVEETGMKGSSRKRASEIAAILNKSGVPATVRRELGSDIDGACGQLRLKQSQKL